MRKTFKVGSVEITVQTAQTIRDDLKAELISQRAQSLEPNPKAAGYWDVFGNLCAHTIEASGLPFDPVTLHEGTALDTYRAYEAWLGMHKNVRLKWQKACNEVDVEDVDPALGPEPLSEGADPNA